MAKEGSGIEQRLNAAVADVITLEKELRAARVLERQLRAEVARETARVARSVGTGGAG